MGTESKLHDPATLPPAPNEQESGLARVRLDALERQTLLLQRIVRVLVCPSHTLATILTTVSQPASYQNCVLGFSQEKNRIHSQTEVTNTWIFISNLLPPIAPPRLHDV